MTKCGFKPGMSETFSNLTWVVNKEEGERKGSKDGEKMIEERSKFLPEGRFQSGEERIQYRSWPQVDVRSITR